jgi:hypothetical protein
MSRERVNRQLFTEDSDDDLSSPPMTPTNNNGAGAGAFPTTPQQTLVPPAFGILDTPPQQNGLGNGVGNGLGLGLGLGLANDVGPLNLEEELEGVVLDEGVIAMAEDELGNGIGGGVMAAAVAPVGDQIEEQFEEEEVVQVVEPLPQLTQEQIIFNEQKGVYDVLNILEKLKIPSDQKGYITWITDTNIRLSEPNYLYFFTLDAIRAQRNDILERLLSMNYQRRISGSPQLFNIGIEGEIPLDVAIESNNTEAVQMLIRYTTLNPYRPFGRALVLLENAVDMKNPDIVRSLLTMPTADLGFINNTTNTIFTEIPDDNKAIYLSELMNILSASYDEQVAVLLLEYLHPSMNSIYYTLERLAPYNKKLLDNIYRRYRLLQPESQMLQDLRDPQFIYELFENMIENNNLFGARYLMYRYLNSSVPTDEDKESLKTVVLTLITRMFVTPQQNIELYNNLRNKYSKFLRLVIDNYSINDLTRIYTDNMNGPYAEEIRKLFAVSISDDWIHKNIIDILKRIYRDAEIQNIQLNQRQYKRLSTEILNQVANISSPEVAQRYMRIVRQLSSLPDNLIMKILKLT